MPVVESKLGGIVIFRRLTVQTGKNQDLYNPVDLEFEYLGIGWLR